MKGLSCNTAVIHVIRILHPPSPAAHPLRKQNTQHNTCSIPYMFGLASLASVDLPAGEPSW